MIKLETHDKSARNIYHFSSISERPANRILTGDVGLLWFLFVSELAFTKFLAAALLAADCIDLPFAIR
ncbi:MAG: hypothetical protein ACK52L_24740, partial [Pirellula sp.]